MAELLHVYVWRRMRKGCRSDPPRLSTLQTSHLPRRVLELTRTCGCQRGTLLPESKPH